MMFAMVRQRYSKPAACTRQPDATMSNLPQITDTVFMIGMSVISRTSSNLIDPNDDTELTPESIKERIIGSKWVLVVEQMQILTIWTVKICLLLMYNRLTSAIPLPQSTSKNCCT